MKKFLSEHAHHLVCGVDGHRGIQEGLVQEGHARLQAESEGRLVRAHHIKLMQTPDQPHCLPAHTSDRKPLSDVEYVTDVKKA